ncbi:hypothetical protein JXA32_14215 [Candidatus Sumerlaeota bacterium]|nr:hypothetical protein [Candidatus Sumerlaeota bacterium]
MSDEIKDKDLNAPKSTTGDKAHAIVRSVIGALGGQAAIELFTALITPPIEKRRNEWMQNVGDMLKKLEEEKKVDLDELRQNEEFIDLLMNASQAAIRTSNQKKREALRNAIENAALNQTPDEALQQMFIRWIDELTEWHLQLLNLLHDPQSPHEIHRQVGCALSAIVGMKCPDLKDRKSFYDQLARDLYQRGLSDTDDMDAQMTGSRVLASHTTDMGKQFLRFIEKPE